MFKISRLHFPAIEIFFLLTNLSCLLRSHVIRISSRSGWVDFEDQRPQTSVTQTVMDFPHNFLAFGIHVSQMPGSRSHPVVRV